MLKLNKGTLNTIHIYK